MAEMLVDSTKLDACLDAEADAIRAKTGGFADIPFDFANNKGFADAIAAIPSGGGLDLIADYTAPEDVSAIQIYFTSAMQGYDIYMVVLEGQFNRIEYPCPAVNREPSTSLYVSNCPANTAVKRVFYMSNYDLQGNDWTLVARTNGANALKQFSTPINYIKVATYYSDGRFKSGFNIKVYGSKVQ